MKISKISMAIIATAAVMAVSPAVFAQADTNKPAGETQPPRAGGRGGMQLTVESIDKAVTLTDAEKPKVKEAVEEFNKAIQEARSADQQDRRTKMGEAREAFNKKMKEILTPEQYTKFEAMPRGGRNRGGGGANAGGAGAGNGGNQ